MAKGTLSRGQLVEESRLGLADALEHRTQSTEARADAPGGHRPEGDKNRHRQPEHQPCPAAAKDPGAGDDQERKQNREQE